MARSAQLERKTKETQISVSLNLDGSGDSHIQTGVGFFDHLLDALQKHGGLDLQIKAQGDLHIDAHHTVEDVGIVLGQAVLQALGDAKGIVRFGYAYCPLDESLARAVIDISGRPYFYFDCPLLLQRVGEFDGELFSEFWRAFAMNAKITLHLELLHGSNQHHAMEAMTKAVAKALRMAVSVDKEKGDVPSTKGVLI